MSKIIKLPLDNNYEMEKWLFYNQPHCERITAALKALYFLYCEMVSEPTYDGFANVACALVAPVCQKLHEKYKEQIPETEMKEFVLKEPAYDFDEF